MPAACERAREIFARAKDDLDRKNLFIETWFPFRCGRGCRVRNSRVTNPAVSRSPLERGAIECDSHVDENGPDSKQIPEYRGARETLREATGTIP